VVEKDSTIAQPPSKEQGQYRDEAEKILRQVQEKNSENKAVNLVLEFAVGKVPEVIENMVSFASQDRFEARAEYPFRSNSTNQPS